MYRQPPIRDPSPPFSTGAWSREQPAYVALWVAIVFCWFAGTAAWADELHVGAAKVNLTADDSMVISGGIGPHYSKGQEGELRTVAVVVAKDPGQRVAIVACDVLFVTADLVDAAVAKAAKATGIPPGNILVNATHTHHAPSTTTVHGYRRDEVFCRRLQDGILKAIIDANAALEGGECQAYFQLGREETFGQNSRMLLSDQTIFWVGDFSDAVRPTGPFDPDLPVLAFRCQGGQLRATVFGHSTHTIGTLRNNVRSPSIYGLAAQRLEQKLGGAVCFLEGASGSTHNLRVAPDKAIDRMQAAVRDALKHAAPLSVDCVAALKRPFKFKVRTFNEAVEDEKVVSYCRKRIPNDADRNIDVFRGMRRALVALQGKDRTSSIQVVQIGDVAIVGLPAEYFTSLGMDIKRRSPFPHTIIAELANDWIGYLPDRDAHRLGGYQTWMGQHSFAEVGTGERMADEAVNLLRELKR